MTADAILQRARDGDREAFAMLVEAHYDFIHGVAWKWCGDGGDAEDVAQDVCIRLARAIRSFRGEAQFRTWLYRLTLNAVRDRHRSATRRRGHERQFALDPAFIAASEDSSAAQLEWLWENVRALPEKQRDAVLLVHADGCSHAEAAAIMGCAEATISWHLHAARKRLKERLQGEAV